MEDVDQQVLQVIEKVQQWKAEDLLRAEIQITFFERKIKKGLFGFMSNEEKLVCERWIVPIILYSPEAIALGTGYASSSLPDLPSHLHTSSGAWFGLGNHVVMQS